MASGSEQYPRHKWVIGANLQAWGRPRGLRPQNFRRPYGQETLARDEFFGAPPSGGGITGTLTATQASDTLTADAALALHAEATLPQASDTLTADAALALHAEATLTQASDTLTADAVLAVHAEATLPQASDTLTADAALALAGTLEATHADHLLTAEAVVGPAPTATGGWWPGVRRAGRRRTTAEAAATSAPAQPALSASEAIQPVVLPIPPRRQLRPSVPIEDWPSAEAVRHALPPIRGPHVGQRLTSDSVWCADRLSREAAAQREAEWEEELLAVVVLSE